MVVLGVIALAGIALARWDVVPGFSAETKEALQLAKAEPILDRPEGWELVSTRTIEPGYGSLMFEIREQWRAPMTADAARTRILQLHAAEYSERGGVPASPRTLRWRSPRGVAPDIEVSFADAKSIDGSEGAYVWTMLTGNVREL